MLSVLLGMVALVVVLTPGRSEAASAPLAPDLPLIEACKPEPPYPVYPDQGLAGAFSERPEVPAAEFSIERIYSSGGLGGFGSKSYDLGCASDPTTYQKSIRAAGGNDLTNLFVGISTTLSAVTDAIERRAWNPQWISSFLDSFVDRATGIINARIWVVLLFHALALSSLMLLWRAREGDISGVAAGTGWVVMVLVLAGLAFIMPTILSDSTQKVGSGLVASLNGAEGNDAASATTDSTVLAVQYQGWLRRTFGDANSEAAKKAGPDLLEASRFSWAEMDAIRSGKISEEDEISRKRGEFASIAEYVKEHWPSAYRHLQADPDVSSRPGPAFLESLFSLSVNFFRIAADLLMVMCFLVLTIVVLVFLIGGLWIMTPAGTDVGKALANSAAMGIGYALAGALGVWLFTIYTQAALAPGMNPWWSLVLLLLGTIIFWTVLRPDRKMLAMITMGRVDGTGAMVKAAKAWLVAHMIKEALDKDEKKDKEATPVSEPQVAAWVGDRQPIGAIEAGPAPAAIESHRYPSSERLAISNGDPAVVEGEVLYTSDASEEPAVRTWVLPTGEQAYRRGEPAEASEVITAPPAGSIGEDEVYQRDERSESAGGEK